MATFSRQLTSCERGPKDGRPVLCLHPLPGAPSVLVVKVAGVECNVHLAPRYTGLLLAAVDAWHADEGELETLRGFLTAAELGRHYTKFSHSGGCITKQTVRAYVYEIKARIASEVSSLISRERVRIRTPRLLEGRRVLGYRIDKCGLEIVQTRPRQASDD